MYLYVTLIYLYFAYYFKLARLVEHIREKRFVFCPFCAHAAFILTQVKRVLLCSSGFVNTLVKHPAL